MRPLTLLPLLLLTGCTTVMQHPTKGDAEWADDLLDCETRAAPLREPIRYQSFMEQCLRTKGWRATGRVL